MPPHRPTRPFLALLALLCVLPALSHSAAPAGAQDAPADAADDWRAYLVTPGPTRFEPLEPLPPVETTDPRFGLVEAYRIAEGGQGWALGARHERIAFWWSGLQAEPDGPFNPYYFAPALLNREREQGFTILGLLMSTPAWAAANSADAERAVPRNLELPWDDPQNYWGRFAEQMARDYAGQIDDWIVWNEPDIQPDDPSAAYYAWAGSVEDYYQLLRVAYRAIKAGNPQATVHLAGLTYWADREANRPQFFERLLDLIAADPSAPENDYYFDVATLHLYTDPRGLYDVPRLYRDLMRARGIDKPVWVNETNVIPWDDPTNRGTGYDVPAGKRCTLADQASYLLQAFSLGVAGDAKRISVYKAEDGKGAAFNGDVDAVERAALVREDGSLRPAYLAYQTAVRYLHDAQAAQYFRGPTAEAVVVDRPEGQRVTALWDAAPRPVAARLAASGTRAELVDAAGQVRPLEAAPDGAYAIALPPATCNTDLADPARYLMGGETYLVVEYDVPADRAPQAPTAEAMPED
ncbi:MAG TPA: hypothetical protein VK066_19705 [Chloroflexota bacterium]|nr:hypothetical protein [Chloroflexota bacterium]